MERAGADQVRMAGDVATMFDEGHGRSPSRTACRSGVTPGGRGAAGRRAGAGAAAADGLFITIFS
jgi:hypothetical protein